MGLISCVSVCVSVGASNMPSNTHFTLTFLSQNPVAEDEIAKLPKSGAPFWLDPRYDPFFFGGCSVFFALHLLSINHRPLPSIKGFTAFPVQPGARVLTGSVHWLMQSNTGLANGLLRGGVFFYALGVAAAAPTHLTPIKGMRCMCPVSDMWPVFCFMLLVSCSWMRPFLCCSVFCFVYCFVAI